MTWQKVLSGETGYSVECADRLAFFDQLPPDSLDLVVGSPPYEAARTYGISFKLRGQEWVDWMVATYLSALRACKGLVAFVLEGQTRGYRWSAVPALLMADLHRAGINLRKPPVFRRIGIPGSGGPDWLRNDWEFIVCASRPGKLPWSDNVACGHTPKYRPGGEVSYRLADRPRLARCRGGVPRVAQVPGGQSCRTNGLSKSASPTTCGGSSRRSRSEARRDSGG